MKPFTTVQDVLDLIGDFAGSTNADGACQVLRFKINPSGNFGRYIRIYWFHRPTHTLMTNVAYTTLNKDSWFPIHELPPVAAMFLEESTKLMFMKQPQPKCLTDFPVWDNEEFRQELAAFAKKWREKRLEESLLNYQLRSCMSILYPNSVVDYVKEPSTGREWRLGGYNLYRTGPYE